MPPALEKEPTQTEEFKFYVDSFFLLSDFRPPGFSGVSPIPFETIMSYAERVGYTDTSDQFFFLDVMRACDTEYRAYAKEQSDRESARQKAASKSHKR